ncbi:MAG: 14-3-3 family protein [Gammaproteobacteria bacterium]|nr:14-3-3 family protein [Gammaproteobacteria bacterium]
MNSPEEAQKVAKTAFDEALAELDNMDAQEESYKETATLMKLIKGKRMSLSLLVCRYNVFQTTCNSGERTPTKIPTLLPMTHE